MKHFLKKGDVIILIIALAVCGLLFLPSLFGGGDNLTARVYENGVVTHEIDLMNVSESYEIKINGAVLLIEKGSVSYKEAMCPDKTCVGFGKLDRAGETASCVPNKTVVTVISSKKATGPDVITY